MMALTKDTITWQLLAHDIHYLNTKVLHGTYHPRHNQSWGTSSPVLSWGGGTPVLSWLGVPLCCPGQGVPHSWGLGHPHGWDCSIPPGLEWGTPAWRELGYPFVRTGIPPSGQGYPLSQDWGTPQRKDMGPEAGVPPRKGPGTRDLGKNLGLGYPSLPVWTDRLTIIHCTRPCRQLKFCIAPFLCKHNCYRFEFINCRKLPNEIDWDVSPKLDFWH